MATPIAPTLHFPASMPPGGRADRTSVEPPSGAASLVAARYGRPDSVSHTPYHLRLFVVVDPEAHDPTPVAYDGLPMEEVLTSSAGWVGIFDHVWEWTCRAARSIAYAAGLRSA